VIVDAFPFFNELDILEVRLTELYDVVDYFILVEATRTHKGDPKPLYYAENRRRFTKWNDKIIPVVVGDLPDGDSQAAIWRREIGQRQAIERGLRDFADDAVVLISDVDEIPRREAVEQLKNGLRDDLVVVFDQTLFYYNVNTSCTSIRWTGTRATTAGNIRALTPDGVRWATPKNQRSREFPVTVLMGGAGWHLSYFGDVNHIRQKMTSFLHQELVNDEHLDADTIARRMAEGIDIWGREGEQRFEIGPATDLPVAIRCDPVRYAKYFHPDWRPQFTEDWYQSDQLQFVCHLARHAPQDGAIVEIGCWEGKSTAAIAQTVAPRELYAVDHWRGNPDEGAEHPATVAAAGRDVFGTYARNMDLLSAGNYTAIVRDWRAWIEEWPRCADDPRIAFLHLDAAHDYESVRDCLLAIKPYLVPGAIVCGDDCYADGVWDGARDALGESVVDAGGRLWVYQHAQPKIR
jgi:beta-1,4-mannosyl-glycoprotein beta-1,4-N-acetylglucosaminyltransferase